ncbi:hypothetical protein SIAM614_23777 [Stappia aggregata IAM 12614]|uniref:Uncharacterized protein n=1 Tax=Roseibium aggregatum (strain ATCC 25650 / DSM 13394 / JCM 20685 / NBRC 16684 / NCIMB 2208 / IAM 12614 / B1) TaxID=384765 RepID=A0NNG2_ROSAI|nr:hypothetical protein SIAM614_23777 [Stappia aggregata IAM 12614] [Roseibium aggregatum IAM 12614]
MLFALGLGPVAHHLLFGAHMFDEALDAFRKIGHGLVGILAATFLDAFLQGGDRGLYLFDARRIGCVEQAFFRINVGDRGEPVFQFVVESVLRLAGLQIQEAQHQRARETEQRGREGRAHAGERRFQARFQVLEDDVGVARADVERLDGGADRADSLEQAPEGTEQAEEHQKAGEVARHLATFLKAHADGIEDRPGSGRRQGHVAGLVAEQGCHRCQQHRRTRVEARVADPETVDPGDFREQADHAAEEQQHTEHANKHDQAIQTRVAHESRRYLREQDEGDEGNDHQEDDHEGQIGPRTGQAVGVEFTGHIALSIT